MKVHLRNVVDTALNCGLMFGYAKFIQLTKKQQQDPNAFVEIMKKTVWESFDIVLDFNDEPDESSPTVDDNKSIGFAVSNITLISEKDKIKS